MNLNKLLADIKRPGPGRVLTPEEQEALRTEASWNQLCEAVMCAKGSYPELEARMRELKP